MDSLLWLIAASLERCNPEPPYPRRLGPTCSSNDLMFPFTQMPTLPRRVPNCSLNCSRLLTRAALQFKRVFHDCVHFVSVLTSSHGDLRLFQSEIVNLWSSSDIRLRSGALLLPLLHLKSAGGWKRAVQPSV